MPRLPLLLVAVLFTTSLLAQPPRAARFDGIGGRPEDAALALQNPDEYAWQLFFALGRQALADKAGVVDPARATFRDYDPDRPVLWETWAMSSGGRLFHFVPPVNRSEVFRDRGVKPVAWSELPRPAPKVFEFYPGKGVEFLLKIDRPPGKFDPIEDDGPGGLEVRMNRPTFDYVRDNNLHSIEGLEEIFRKNLIVRFPNESKEIKARWVPIGEKDKPRYHWRTTTKKDGTKKLWGLSALHITARDLPTWFWCDFEHVDFEPHAELYSRDTTTRGLNPPSGRDGVRKETVGTRWETMRLRGTQIAFTDPIGAPTILANSQIEHGFQQTSSCISCHARATAGLRSARPDLPRWQVNILNPNYKTRPIIQGPVGAPDPSAFLDADGNRVFMQTGFTWSAPARAMSTKDAPPAR